MTDLARSLCDWAFDIFSCISCGNVFCFRLLLCTGESWTLLASPVATVEADVVHAILRLATMTCAVHSDPDRLLDPVDVTLDRRFPITNF